jgi:chitinase
MTIFAPYTYAWSTFNTKDYKIPNLSTAMSVLNLKAATSAFVISEGSSDKIWSVVTDAIPDMKKFVDAGNLLIISIGGENGPFLQNTMTLAQEIEALSQLLLQTGCRHIDFDIEGGETTNLTGITQTNQTIAALQKQFPGLYVSYTLPIGQPQWGSLQASGLAILENAVSLGVNVNIVNGMAMDIGVVDVKWGTMATSMVENMKTQIATIFPNKTDSQLYGMLGCTPMIGKNDDGSIFTLQDATTLGMYAKEKGLGLLSFWALQRDQSIQSGGLATSSMVTQNDFDYYNAFLKGLNGNVVVPPVVTPAPTVTTPVVTPAPTVTPPVVTPAPTVTPPVVVPAPTVTPPVVTPAPTVTTWTIRKNYIVGDIVVYNKKTYKCASSHTSIESWSPSIYTQALWILIPNIETPVENVPEPSKKYIILDSGNVNSNKVVGNITTVIPNPTQNYKTQLIFEIPNDITKIPMNTPINITMTRNYL